jgi:hypothetical protein
MLVLIWVVYWYKIGYHISSTSPFFMNFVTAEYCIKKMFPSSKVISSPLWCKLGLKSRELLKSYGAVVGGLVDSTEHRFVQVWFLYHFFITRVVKCL